MLASEATPLCATFSRKPNVHKFAWGERKRCSDCNSEMHTDMSQHLYSSISASEIWRPVAHKVSGSVGSTVSYALTRIWESGMGDSAEPVNSLCWSVDTAFLLPAISVSWNQSCLNFGFPQLPKLLTVIFDPRMSLTFQCIWYEITVVDKYGSWSQRYQALLLTSWVMWVSHFSSMYLGFLIGKMVIATPTFQGSWGLNEVMQVKQQPVK